MTREEAIQIVKTTKDWGELRLALQELVPELRESEDERIRKEIIEVLRFVPSSMWEQAKTNYNRCFTYLEKQKEQKPAEWHFPYGMNETVDKLIAIAKCLEMAVDCQFNGYTGMECGKFLRDLARKQVDCTPAEWSEEDEQFLLICKNALHKYQRTDQWDANIISKWLDDKFKFLRPSWKPSEEQMKAFRGYIEDFQGRANAAVGGWNNFDVMIRLYEQLKKL